MALETIKNLQTSSRRIQNEPFTSSDRGRRALKTTQSQQQEALKLLALTRSIQNLSNPLLDETQSTQPSIKPSLACQDKARTCAAQKTLPNQKLTTAVTNATLIRKALSHSVHAHKQTIGAVALMPLTNQVATTPTNIYVH